MNEITMFTLIVVGSGVLITGIYKYGPLTLLRGGVSGLQRLWQASNQVDPAPIRKFRSPFTGDEPTEQDNTDNTVPPQSNYVLTIKSSAGAPVGKTFTLTDGENAIGRQVTREPRVTSFLIPEDRSISVDHAYVSRGPQGFSLEDRGSKYGTTLNNQLIDAHVPVLLKSGDNIKIGNTVLRFHAHDDATQLVAFTEEPQTMPAIFTVRSGPNKGKQLELVDTKVIIGRGVEAHWQIADKKMSRKHASLERSGDVILLKDLRSANGTRLGNKRITVQTELQLKDRIKLGNTELELIQV